ncbi:Nascent polypeptide-associated complex subunit beta [Penicillium herquei]|nr:Nascent polypeptide-associated complex subunit beta [Penicillium herquei]
MSETLGAIVAGCGFLPYGLWHPLESISSVGPTLNEATFGLLGYSFKPDRDIPSLEGKVILLTGGNAGIGKETVRQLAKHQPARIYLAARTESKALATIESIQSELASPVDIRYLSLDLCSFKSIRAAAAKFQADSDRLDTLILNAGTMGNPAVTTEDGFEVQLGTNHVGHFLLTKLLLPTLQATVAQDRARGVIPDVRVLSLTSVAHSLSPTTFEEITSTPLLLEKLTWYRYGASKAANIFFATELARRYPEITTVAVHPGAVQSGLYGHAKAINSFSKLSVNAILSLFFRTVSTGALSSLWAATTAQENLVSGAYYTSAGYRSKGTSFAGQSIIAELLDAGHTVLNLDLASMSHPSVHTLKTDLTDSGQVFNALSGQWTLTEPFPEGLPPRPDAVIHMAGYARNMLVPDNETFRSNTQGTYNICEAACKLGIRKIIIASSTTVYGVAFAQGDVNYPSFPIEEDQDVCPTDTYAIAKLCNERVARGFAARFGADIYILRIGHVIGPDEYNEEIFSSYVHEPSRWKVHGWSYIDSRDLGGMCEAGLRTDGLGFQIFNATNDTITNLTPTEDFLKTSFPETPITRKLEEFEAPLSNAKMKKMLGFQERHGWRKYFNLWDKKRVVNAGERSHCGKGTPRRKVKKVHKTSGADDKKLQAVLKKMNTQPIQGIEEVNMFKEDGNVIHFANPRVHGAVASNTYALYGNGEEKELTELVPGILNQLGPDSLASLRKLAESYQNMQKAQGEKNDDEDDIPDLVEGENFEDKAE